MLIITPPISSSFYFIVYFADLQAQFVWKINFCFNNMLEKISQFSYHLLE